MRPELDAAARSCQGEGVLQRSAGVLLYRFRENDLEVFLIYPGGPFFARKDLGSWSIPKGEQGPGEDPLDAARRELEEDRAAPGWNVSAARARAPARIVQAFFLEGDCDADAIRSNTFSLGWSGHPAGVKREFPEVDRAAWFAIDDARRRISAGQLPLLDELARLVRGA